MPARSLTEEIDHPLHISGSALLKSIPLDEHVLALCGIAAVLQCCMLQSSRSWSCVVNRATLSLLLPAASPCRLQGFPFRYLHRDTKALVQRSQAAAPVGLHDAVRQPLEVPGDPLAQVSGQARSHKVQRVDYQQRPCSSQASCRKYAALVGSGMSLQDPMVMTVSSDLL